MTNTKKDYKQHAISLDDYHCIVKYIEQWHLDISDEYERSNRQFIREFILLLANAGLRFSEARALRWKDITIIDTLEPVANKQMMLVEIDIVKPISGSRYLIGGGGGIFTRIKQWSNFTSQNDYVFVNNGSAEKITIDVYLALWKQIMTGSGLRQDEQQYEYSSLRGSYASWRLYAGVDVELISQVMGTTVDNIRKRYGYINLQYRSKEAMFDVMNPAGRIGF